MKWIASFLDAIYANLFDGEGFFGSLLGKLAGSVENIAYNVESGNVNIGALSRTMERLVFWLPIVFIVCLLLDVFIRSRFVRYSYQDEYQAKKSVWWNWQSDADAALALESGAEGVQMLTGGEQTEQEAQEAVEESAAQEPVQDMEEAPQEAEAETEAEDETDDTEDTVDRGPVTSARQNKVRNVVPAAQRVKSTMEDMRDQLTIFKGAVAFIPRALKRNARLRKQSMQEEARHNRQRFNERIHRHSAKGRDEAAQAEALFDTQEKTYVDADFEQNEAVNTGGIEGVDFAQAAQVMQAAVQEQQAAEQQEQAAEPAEEQAEEQAE
ncbi:MAG: hypothetical protein J6L88_03970 [Clostridia bacterium]|nr:hypothetical protein [Clostridia bacterium]